MHLPSMLDLMGMEFQDNYVARVTCVHTLPIKADVYVFNYVIVVPHLGMVQGKKTLAL